eukprot:GHVS01105393.1.p1 GENE.GHVS01105393.1~~GHVS01105393.1.p1  ORF type:complete len:404 (+),score=35.86 GHVS01105393.1:19-1230(+)
MLFGRYIRRRGLEELKNYQYKSAGYTLGDRLLNYWWERAVKFVPLWVAPNVLTLLGFFAAIFSFTLLLFYSPTLAEPAPTWLYLTIAMLIFVYQTLDALDGKQARRTGTSSPLGQLFDHGCDVMAVTAISMTTIGITCSGVGLLQYLAMVISTQIHQFIYMWWEYHFHIFYSATGPIGVTEAQMGMIFCCIGAAVFGPELYSINLISLLPPAITQYTFLPSSFTVRQALICGLIVMNSGVAVYDAILGIYKARNRGLASAQLGSFLFFIYMQWCFYRKCLLIDTDVSGAVVYYLMSTTYSILVVRLCLSATCKIPFNTVQWPVLPFYAGVALLHWDTLMASSFYGLCSYKVFVFVLLSLWSTLYLCDLLVTSVRDICDHLQISCFVIPSDASTRTTDATKKIK